MKSLSPPLGAVLRDSGHLAAELRRREGLSQAELAELSGLHPNTVANFERGACDSSVLVLSLIYIYLGSPGVLIEEDGFQPLPRREGQRGPIFPRSLISLPTMARIIGERVRERRLALGLTMDDVAHEAGLHANTVWNLENGLVAPSASTSFRLYRCLGIGQVAAGGSDIEFFGDHNSLC